MQFWISKHSATMRLGLLLAISGGLGISGLTLAQQASPSTSGLTNSAGGMAAGSPVGDDGTNGLRLQINRGPANFNLYLKNTEERSFYSVRSAVDPGFGQWFEAGYLLGALGTNVTLATISGAENDMAFFVAKKDVKNIQVELPQILSQASPLTVTINGGPAIALAVLVNDTNTASAVWTNFTRSPIVALGSSNGTYQVRLGFAFADGTTNWITREITVDSVAAGLFISGPETGTVAKPVLQLTGYTTKPASSILFDVSNAAGTITNQIAQVTGQFFDTNTLGFTTNWFQCYDVELFDGENIVTVRATDLAGNTTTTNLSYTLDLSSDTSAPLMTVDWPNTGSLLSGDEFSIEGRVDDETASISAEVLRDGQTLRKTASVGRDGRFWLSGLPLGTNGSAVTLISSDAAGNSGTNTLAVLRGDIRITVNPIPDNALVGRFVALSGTVNETNLVVIVNGVAAVVDGSAWSAENVPIPGEGTARFLVEARRTGPTLSGDGGTLVNYEQDTPSFVRLSSYYEYSLYRIIGFFATVDLIIRRTWNLGQGGQSYFYDSFDSLTEGGPWPSADPMETPAVRWVYNQAEDYRRQSHQAYSEACFCFVERTSEELAIQKIRSGVQLVFGGKPLSGQSANVRLTVRALEHTKGLIDGGIFGDYPLDDPAFQTVVAPGGIFVAGMPLNPTSTNAAVGEIYLMGPPGSTRDVTPKISTLRQNYHSFQIEVEPVKLSILVDANRDGKITPEDEGQATRSKPYVFWANNDIDRTHAVDDGDSEEDDLVINDPGIPPNQRVVDAEFIGSSGLPSIPSMRDLEDYTRLWLPGLSNLIATLPPVYSVELSWRVPQWSRNPTIRLFKAAELDGGQRYLSDETVAERQIENSDACPYIGMVGPNQSIDLSAAYRRGYPGSGIRGDYYLFCGVARGKAQLVLQIKTQNGEVVGRTGAYIEIKDIKEMYERWSVGEDSGVEPIEHSIAVADGLPTGVSAFRYAAVESPSTSYVLHVHGWNMETWEKDRFAETAFKRLYWQGYQGRFGSFRWPTDNGFDGLWDVITDPRNYDNSEFIAWKSATGLKNQLVYLYNRYPGRVYLLAHSMGNVVAGEALRLAGNNQLVNTYVASQAAVPVHAYDSGNLNLLTFLYDHPQVPGRLLPYGPTTPNIYGNWFSQNSAAVGRRVNFFNSADFALAPDAWEFNQILKPSTSGQRYFYSGNPHTGNLSYYTAGSSDDDPPWNNFGQGPPDGSFFRFDLVGNVRDRYQVMAFAAEARSSALGSTANTANLTANVDLRGFWPQDSSGRNYGDHKWHSAQFRMTNMKQAGYWLGLLGADGFDLK